MVGQVLSYEFYDRPIRMLMKGVDNQPLALDY